MLTKSEVVKKYQIRQIGTVCSGPGLPSNTCPMCRRGKSRQALVCLSCRDQIIPEQNVALAPAALPREPSAVELAWAAGITDGEGCISLARRQGKTGIVHTLYLKITMGDKPTIERLVKIFGVGSIHIQDKVGPRVNASWSWWTASRKAQSVLIAIRPYLVTKAYEADLALEFLSGMTVARGRGLKAPPEIIEERDRLWILLRDAKPTARFRKIAKEDK